MILFTIIILFAGLFVCAPFIFIIFLACFLGDDTAPSNDYLDEDLMGGPAYRSLHPYGFDRRTGGTNAEDD